MKGSKPVSGMRLWGSRGSMASVAWLILMRALAWSMDELGECFRGKGRAARGHAFPAAAQPVVVMKRGRCAPPTLPDAAWPAMRLWRVKTQIFYHSHRYTRRPRQELRRCGASARLGSPGSLVGEPRHKKHGLQGEKDPQQKSQMHSQRAASGPQERQAGRHVAAALRPVIKCASPCSSQPGPHSHLPFV